MKMAIVPAYNESAQIAAVVRALLSVVDEVVVIDDASADETAVRARAAGATVLSHRLNRGQGAALETGHRYARERGADFVVHFDGDGQFDVADIGLALAHLQAHDVDVVLGSRFLDTRSSLPWFKRVVLLPLAALFHRWLYGIRLTDAHNGFRILNKHALERLCLTQDRMAHATEILALIRTHNLRFAEYPVKVTYHRYGQTGRGAFAIIRDLFLGKFVG